MIRVTLDNAHVERTIRPLYAQTQATPAGGYLDPEWDRSVDILPGMVMTRLGGEVVTLYGQGSAKASHTVFGLSALFVASQFGIDELRPTGINTFATWLGDDQAWFEILAPAFDTSAVWANTEDGSKVPLRVTLDDHDEGPGKLTTAGQETNKVSTEVAAHLIQVVGDNKIIVSLEK